MRSHRRVAARRETCTEGGADLAGGADDEGAHARPLALRLPWRGATIDDDRLPCHERGRVRGQEDRRKGDLLHAPPPAHPHARGHPVVRLLGVGIGPLQNRSEEHTSELQSLAYLVCRLLLEKKKEHIV